ncbi:MAG: hypothetical protein COT25_03515 [Candidatus Kerfeldbacteria bacterium CG08_land_8_20_14_0_20_42_7]|uniref:Uncharacterized protein n=1 Tax=Candidatus Kerfeldbacteria bacterium CG08_land_8_20_14_0_20_42_7 TaxID=2014245 RepID=A0A2H0YS78_9BACT|nr:MAG: hypothetical protein COT25_03515 [Candidatus Kerfeldbacteria bacterium CG08_land_8_20_14_0_20_42_7]
MLRAIFCVVFGFIFLATSPIYEQPINTLSGQNVGLGLLGLAFFVGGLIGMVVSSGGKKK